MSRGYVWPDVNPVAVMIHWEKGNSQKNFSRNPNKRESPAHYEESAGYRRSSTRIVADGQSDPDRVWHIRADEPPSESLSGCLIPDGDRLYQLRRGGSGRYGDSDHPAGGGGCRQCLRYPACPVTLQPGCFCREVELQLGSRSLLCRDRGAQTAGYDPESAASGCGAADCLLLRPQ